MLAHPAIITPYTPREETAKRYIIPTLISETTNPGAKGMTAHPAKLKTIVIMGASIKTILLEPLGIIFSFVISFKASAKLCSKPNGPTTFGPLLNCIKAKTFLSA